jgi:hypothetical protein
MQAKKTMRLGLGMAVVAVVALLVCASPGWAATLGWGSTHARPLSSAEAEQTRVGSIRLCGQLCDGKTNPDCPTEAAKKLVSSCDLWDGKGQNACETDPLASCFTCQNAKTYKDCSKIKPFDVKNTCTPGANGATPCGNEKRVTCKYDMKKMECDCDLPLPANFGPACEYGDCGP